MAKRNRDKWIVKAWEALGYNDDSTKEHDFFFTESGLKLELANQKQIIVDMEDVIITAKETITEASENSELLQKVLDQAEIEEMKFMNPNAKAVYKF